MSGTQWTTVGVAVVRAVGTARPDDDDAGSPDRAERTQSGGWQKHIPSGSRSPAGRLAHGDGPLLRTRSAGEGMTAAAAPSSPLASEPADADFSITVPVSATAVSTPPPPTIDSPTSDSSSSSSVAPDELSSAPSTCTHSSGAVPPSGAALDAPLASQRPAHDDGHAREQHRQRLKQRTLFTATARFDFDGRCPNELSFQRGQRLMVVATESSKAAAPGWWKARLRGRGRLGWIPAAYVQKDEYAGERGVALFPYRASADEPRELSMETGEELTVLRHNQDSNGWWKVIVRGQRGYVPGSHAQLLGGSDDDDSASDTDDSTSDDAAAERHAIAVPDVRRQSLLVPSAGYLRDILVDLLTSERKLAEQMKGLVRDYMFPMTILQDWSSGDTLLSEEDMFSIFGNITQIAASSSRVIALTEEAVQQVNLLDASANLVHRLVSVLGPYKRYFANRVMSRVIINKRKVEDFQLAALLELRRVEQGLSLDAALSLPVKRIDYYAEMVNRMQRGMPRRQDADFGVLVETLATLEQRIAELREITQRTEEQIQLVELQCSFTKKVPQLTSSATRRFIAKDEYKRVVFNKKDVKHPVLFLFTDCLVVAKRRSERSYVWWATVPLLQTVIISRDGHGAAPVIAITEGPSPSPCLITALHDQQHQLCVALLRNCSAACNLLAVVPIVYPRSEKVDVDKATISSSSPPSSLSPASSASSSSPAAALAEQDSHQTPVNPARERLKKPRSRLSMMGGLRSTGSAIGFR